jgi:hypothetical protein
LKWLDRFLVLNPEHVNDLERNAATNQYVGGMTKDHAELSAYDRYRKIQHAMAAAHHLDGMDDGKNIVKNQNMADKHYAMFNLHMKVLGHNPLLNVPPEVQAFRNSEREPSHVFRPHPADLLVLTKK